MSTAGATRSPEVACPACGRRNRVPAVAGGTPHCGACRAALPWLVAAGDADFDDVVGRSSLPVLLDLWAPWCGPCRAVAPAVARVARELAGRVKAVQVNVDEAPGVASRFGARGIPTLILLRDGAEVGRQVGALSADRLVDWTRATLA